MPSNQTIDRSWKLSSAFSLVLGRPAFKGSKRGDPTKFARNALSFLDLTDAQPKRPLGIEGNKVHTRSFPVPPVPPPNDWPASACRKSVRVPDPRFQDLTPESTPQTLGFKT